MKPVMNLDEVEFDASAGQSLVLDLAAKTWSGSHQQEAEKARDLVAGSRLTFADRGSHELKGVPGEWSLAEVTS